MLLVFIILVLSITIFGYFTMYKKLEENTEENTKIILEQLSERIELIFDGVNVELSRMLDDSTVQDVLAEDAPVNSETTSLLRQKTVVAEAYSTGNSIKQINIYNVKGKSIYPNIDSDIGELLSEDNLNVIKENNGNAVWIPTQYNHIMVVKKILLSEHNYTAGGYVLAYLDKQILELFKEDLLYKEVAMELANSNGEILASYNPHEISKESSFEFVRKIDSANATLRFYISRRVLLDDISWMIVVFVQVLFVASIVYFAMSVVIGGMITQPFRDLITIMKNSNGEFNKIENKYRNYEVMEFTESYNQLVERNQQLIHDIYIKQLQVLQTQLESIQSQINPHFLYNTLDSVYYSLAALNNHEAANIVFSLSELFRYALKGENSIELSKEINVIRKYLEIEKFRFGKRIRWNISVDRSMENAMIPKLLIQPLVENAVKHGIEPCNKECYIGLNITGYNNIMIVNIRDNGIGMEAVRLEEVREMIKQDADTPTLLGSSLGLYNVAQRIRIYYGKEAEVFIDSTPNKGTEVKIILKDYLNIWEEQ